MSLKELRRFGIGVGAMILLVFGLALPWLAGRAWPRWPFILGLPLLLLGLAWPAWLRPLHFGWMKLAAVLAWVNTRIILAILFFLIFTPLAFFRRLLGKDPLGLKPGENESTYWRQAATDSKPRFDRPF
ncbi:MAG TPA: SxtJ family membrane protein [bacterium]|nr:SxtJ family membrane protein [bacterium]